MEYEREGTVGTVEPRSQMDRRRQITPKPTPDSPDYHPDLSSSSSASTKANASGLQCSSVSTLSFRYSE